MAKKENSLQSAILEYLKGNPRKGIKGIGGWWLNFHGGSVFMPRGIPDIIGCFKGRFIALEVKRPGEQPTKLQAKTLELLQAAGAVTGIVHDVDETREIMGKVK